MWKRFALKNTSEGRFNEDIKIDHLLGAEGTALSALRPYGKGEIYGTTYEVKTLGDYLTAGAQFKVMKVDKDHKIYVEQIKE